ncbi:hypothetical protein Q5Z34_17625 [Listeria innocua]
MYVKEKTAHLTKAEYDQGVTTQEIAEVLGIQRTNSSKDLNQLVREGKLIKTDGRPVRYIYQTLATHVKPAAKHVVSYKETPVSEEKNTLQIDKIILKDPIPLKELYPTIKHVYDQNGVLIGRRKNGVLRCTAKGMGRLIS